MIASSDPIERSLGLCWYANDAPGIGGRLRASPEEFVVEECETPPPLTGGPYLVCRLTKRNWEQSKAVRAIADRLGISHRRISFSGTKDRRAVTTQLVALYHVEADAVRALSIPDMTLEPLGQANRGLALGDLAGNRFRIVVRDCDPDDLEARCSAARAAVAAGAPNYVGLQRFGVVRPVTHLVGRLLASGDVAGAVTAYIGQSFPTEAEPDPGGPRGLSRRPRPEGRALPVPGAAPVRAGHAPPPRRSPRRLRGGAPCPAAEARLDARLGVPVAPLQPRPLGAIRARGAARRGRARRPARLLRRPHRHGLGAHPRPGAADREARPGRRRDRDARERAVSRARRDRRGDEAADGRGRRGRGRYRPRGRARRHPVLGRGPRHTARGGGRRRDR